MPVSQCRAVLRHSPHGATVLFVCGLPAAYPHDLHAASVDNEANQADTNGSPPFVVTWADQPVQEQA